MKKLVKLSADDLETLRAVGSDYSLYRVRSPASQRKIDESKLPGAGVRLIFGIVVGLGLTMAVVGAIWRFLTR